MTTLNLAQIKQYDSEDMLHLLSSFSEQCKRGWEIGGALTLDRGDEQTPNNIVIAGMGGSGIGGDFVKAVLGGQSPCIQLSSTVAIRFLCLLHLRRSSSLSAIPVILKKPSYPSKGRLHRGRKFWGLPAVGS